MFYGIITHAKQIAEYIEESGASTRTRNRCTRRFDAITINGLSMPKNSKPNNLWELAHIETSIHVACTIMTVITVYSSIYSESTRHRIAHLLLNAANIDKIFNKTLANHIFAVIDTRAKLAAQRWMIRQKTYNIQHIAAEILKTVVLGATSAKNAHITLIPWNIPENTTHVQKKRKRHHEGPGGTRIQFIDTEPIVHLRREPTGHTCGDTEPHVYKKYDDDNFVQKNTKTSILYNDDNTIVRKEQFDNYQEAKQIVKCLRFQNDVHERTKTSKYGPICPPMTDICVNQSYVYSTTIRGRTIKNLDDIVYDIYTMQAFLHRISWIHYDFICICEAIPADTGIKNMILSTI